MVSTVGESDVRLAVYRHFVSAGGAPPLLDPAQTLDADPSGIREILETLNLKHLLVLDAAWQLAQTWYHKRLDPSWRRKTWDETRALFDELGLSSRFWQLAP